MSERREGDEIEKKERRVRVEKVIREKERCKKRQTERESRRDGCECR